MAMGQQRAIHPFFQKDHGLSTRSAPEHVAGDVVPVDPAQNDRPPFDSSLAAPAPPVAMLEHDPNSSRRKRRRTEDIADSGLGEDGSGNGASDEDSESLARIPSAAPHTPPPETVGQVQDSHKLEQRPQAGALPSAEFDGNPATLDGTLKKSPQRKTLKLNANGRLLSSPTLSGVEDKSRQKGKGRPKKSGNRKTKEDGKALVVMKYASEGGHGERIGSLIDDIISGRKKHGVPERPVIPTSTASQPPKPTHPFFWKKPTHKSDTPSQATQTCQDAKIIESSGEDAPKSPPAARDKPCDRGWSFPSFKQRPKFPEPIDPVWPPRDLVHVRGFGAANERHAVRDPLGMDQKKAKMAAIRVGDQENVLRSTTTEAQRSESFQVDSILRIPGRQVASGRVLQKAVSKQLSRSASGTGTDNEAPSEHCHPAIRKLSSSIPTSMTAFDRGELEHLLWAHKYMPTSAEEVLQTGREPLMLRDWLKYLMVSAVDTGKPSKHQAETKQKEDKKRAKKRRKAEELDEFIVSSGSEKSGMGELSDSDEDELAGDVTVPSKRTIIRSGDLRISAKTAGERGRISNAILLSGPPGCGKTASVYAVAKELDFEVFEINPGSRRSSKDILERVGDMTRNHLVHNLNTREGQSSSPSSQPNATEEVKENKMSSFFKPTSAKRPKPVADQEAEPKHAPSQKQSLILLEEADLIFEEDKTFWSGVMALIGQSKRPIVITCNDESLIPLEDLSLHAILRYRPPPQDLAVDYLLMVAANEGHMLRREAVEDLYAVYRKDIRKAITDMSFWCQMCIGSEKSGLDWIVDRWPPGSDLDQHGDPLRVISLNAYQRFMGWFSRDMMLSSAFDSEIEACHESLHWWHLDLQDSESMSSSSRLRASDSESKSFVSKSNTERLHELRQASETVDMRSDLDMICSSCTTNPKKDTIDMSTPPVSVKQRMSYIEGYPLLQTDLESDYTQLPASIGSTFEVLMRRVSQTASQLDAESSQALRVLANASQPGVTSPSATDALAAFAPIMQANYVFPLPTGRLAPSFENGSGTLFEDLAPYIRAIVAFDVRLEKHRQQLSGLLSQGSAGEKVRKTRASRAALEGGSKSYTRKERWFPPDTNPARILATGNQEWQDLLVQRGYFALGSGSVDPRREFGDNNSESSGDGGI